MSRCNNLYQAFANAVANSSGFSWNRFAIGPYIGSNLRARSVVSIMGACRFDGSWASGTVPCASGFLGVHWKAPAGLLVNSQSKLNRLFRNPLPHFVGVFDHAPSRPLVMVSPPLPLPKAFFQPQPCISRGAASGSGPMLPVAG